jgi:hypothetical protein
VTGRLKRAIAMWHKEGYLVLRQQATAYGQVVIICFMNPDQDVGFLEEVISHPGGQSSQ